MDSDATTAAPLARIERRITELKIADSYAIKSAVEAISANDTLGQIKKLAKDLESAKRAELEPAKMEERRIRENFRTAESTLERAEAVVKRALGQFQAEERRRIDEERRLREEAARKEQARLREQAEKERQEAEARAAKLIEQGKADRAAALLANAEANAAAKEQTADLLPATVVVDEPTALRGFQSSTKWICSVEDPRAFLAWAAAQEHIDVATLVDFRTSGLNHIAAMYQDRLLVPGTKIRAEIASSRR